MEGQHAIAEYKVRGRPGRWRRLSRDSIVVPLFSWGQLYLLALVLAASCAHHDAHRLCITRGTGVEGACLLKQVELPSHLHILSCHIAAPQELSKKPSEAQRVLQPAK